MEVENLFQLLGLEDPQQWTYEGVQRAWNQLVIDSRNNESSIHNTKQQIYRYLCEDSADAKAVVEALTAQPFDTNEHSNIVLQRLLSRLAATGEPLTVKNGRVSAALERHVAYSGFQLFCHEHSPYKFAITPGWSPGEEFVLASQAGPPLKNGEPRFQESGSFSNQLRGPTTFVEHLREFFVDLLLFRWLRTNSFTSLAAVLLVLAAGSWWLWQSAETLIERTDEWENRWVSDEVYEETDATEEILAEVRAKFSEIEREGEKAFGWDEWWKASPSVEFAYQINTGDLRKRELYKQIRSRMKKIARQVSELTPELDRMASHARSTKSRDGIYKASRVLNEAKEVLQDMVPIHQDLIEFQALD